MQRQRADVRGGEIREIRKHKVKSTESLKVKKKKEISLNKVWGASQ